MALTSEAQFFKNKFQALLSNPNFEQHRREKARKRVLNELSQLIASQPIVLDDEPSSNLFKILVKKLKNEMTESGLDTVDCDIASRKLAKFVETVMTQAYHDQKRSRRRPSSAFHSSNASSRETPHARSRTAGSRMRNRSVDKKAKINDSDAILRGLGFPDGERGSSATIEKVPTSYVRDIQKTSPLFVAKIDGRRVYVQEVGEGDKKKAVISRPNTEELGVKREWSSWMVNIGNRKEEWSNWLKQKASLVESSTYRNLDISTPSGSKSPSPSRPPNQSGTPQNSSSSSSWMAVVDSVSQSQNFDSRSRKVIAREYRNDKRDSSSDSYRSSNSDVRTSTSRAVFAKDFCGLKTKSPVRPSTTALSNLEASSSARVRPVSSKGYSFSISKTRPPTT